MPAAPRNRLIIYRQELVDLTGALAERRRYYAEQQALIDDLVEAGNTRLMELNHDILYATGELKRLKTELYRINQDKRLLLEDLELLRRELMQMDGSSPGFTGIIQIG